MKRKKHKKLKCGECNQSAVGPARAHWLFIGSAAQVRSTSRANNLFVLPVEDKWFCCIECFGDFTERKMEQADCDEQRARNFIQRKH